MDSNKEAPSPESLPDISDWTQCIGPAASVQAAEEDGELYRGGIVIKVLDLAEVPKVPIVLVGFGDRATNKTIGVAWARVTKLPNKHEAGPDEVVFQVRLPVGHTEHSCETGFLVGRSLEEKLKSLDRSVLDMPKILRCYKLDSKFKTSVDELIGAHTA